MNTPTRTLIAAALCLAVTACTPGMSSTASPETPDPTVTTSAATPTPTATPSSDEARAAFTRLQEFVAVIDKLAADPKSDLNEVSSVARGQADLQYKRNLLTMREKGLRSTGHGVLAFGSSAPGAESGQLIITACLDMSKVDVIDQQGASRTGDLPRKTRGNYTMERDAKTSVWYLTTDEVVGTC